MIIFLQVPKADERAQFPLVAARVPRVAEAVLGQAFLGN
jgi:hypothetical protein